MLWGINWDHTSAWDAHASSWIAAGSQHLLAFNEPELASQSNLDPTAAVDAYRKHMQPFAGKAQLGAPAITNDGREWMTEFLGNCSDCTVDFVPIHWVSTPRGFPHYLIYAQPLSQTASPLAIFLRKTKTGEMGHKQTLFPSHPIPQAIPFLGAFCTKI